MIDRCFTFIIWLTAGIVFLAFGWLISDVVVQGVGKLSWEFLTDEPTRSGREGGIYPIIVSTLLILGTALVIVIPIGLGSAIWLAEFTKKSSKRVRSTRLILDVLAGVPSIVFGLFGYAFFCGFLGLGFSILSGGLTLHV